MKILGVRTVSESIIVKRDVKKIIIKLIKSGQRSSLKVLMKVLMKELDIDQAPPYTFLPPFVQKKC